MRTFSILLALLSIAASGMAQVGPWPMERQDRWGTGRALVGPDPSTQIAPWIKYRVAGDLVSHAPAIRQDGAAFFGAWIPSLFTKFSTATGATEGSFEALNFIHSLAAIGESGRVYFTTSAPGGRLFAIDPTIMDYDWTFLTNSISGGDFESASPTIGPDGDVVIPSTTGNAWRIDDANGLPVWTKTGLGQANQTIVFTRDDSRVIVGHANTISALFYGTGIQDWAFNAGSNVGGPGVAEDGTIIFGCDGGTVFALNPNGTFKWSWLTLGQVKAPPAFSSDGRAYIGGYDRRLYCLDVATGARLWSYTGSNDFRQAPIVGSDGRVYIHDRVGRLYCISPSGQLIWAVVVPATEGRGEMSMGADGTIYVAGSGIYAITQAFTNQLLEAFAAVRGIHVSGGLSELQQSDETYLRYRPGITFSSSQAPVELTFDVTCPRTQLSKLNVTFEAGASTSNLNQQLYLRNYQTAQWDEIDARPTTLSDSVVQLNLDTNLNRYLEAGTRRVRLRATWKQTGPVFAFPWNIRIDHVRMDLLPPFVYP
ncbi:MAG: PQQ-binding-like beta-propeller repeat protein [Armatimonadota bacterium]|nr:PQQ-binding-like beta-propeller repeat protein [Armatimonadota bacterium]